MLQGGVGHVITGARDAALQPADERRSATNAMRFIGLGRRTSAGGGLSALKYVGLGKRHSAMKYIGLGRRAPERSVTSTHRHTVSYVLRKSQQLLFTL